MHRVESLICQCQYYILMHLEEFYITHLALLPLSTRKELLYLLPVADICLRLENAEFTTGIDMAAFWNSTWDHNSVGVADSPHDRDDVKCYAQDEWDATEYARETIYGIVATCATGHILDVKYRGIFVSTHGYNCEIEPYSSKLFGWEIPVVSFLYAVRKSCVHCLCNPVHVFPSRYSHKSNKSDKELTIYEVMNCFSRTKGEFPKIFPEFFLDDINLDHVFFLRNAVYLGINGRPFEERGLEFIKAVLKEATNLEVLLLDHWGEEDEWEVEFFDEFCSFLSSCQAFMSNFRLFKILSLMDTKGLMVSRKNFNQLITAYFAAPTDHMQKLHISRTKIRCSDVSFECSPTIEQRYRSVSKYKATPKSLSHWLGESISELPLPTSVEAGTYFFKVEDKSRGDHSRKRKHSELEYN